MLATGRPAGLSRPGPHTFYCLAKAAQRRCPPTLAAGSAEHAGCCTWPPRAPLLRESLAAIACGGKPAPLTCCLTTHPSPPDLPFPPLPPTPFTAPPCLPATAGPVLVPVRLHACSYPPLPPPCLPHRPLAPGQAVAARGHCSSARWRSFWGLRRPLRPLLLNHDNASQVPEMRPTR